MVIAPWRRALACSLLVSPVILLGSGCKTASGWKAPWSAWGGASSPNATALNISKPSTQAPAPNNTPGQPNHSLASSGGTGAAAGNPSGVAVAGATSPAGGVTAYPATPQADAYPTQTAGNTQLGNGTGGSVEPAGGMQVGPYSMQSKSATSGYAGVPKANTPPAEGPYGSREEIRTADQSAAGPYRGGEASGAMNPGAAPPGDAGSVYGGGEGAATATESSVYGSGEETSPAGATSTSSLPPYSPAESPAESASAPTYGPPNTVGPAASRPSTSPPPSTGAGRSSLPASISSSGGYRPGSTGGSGVSNAGYDQPQNASLPEGATTGGTTYK